MVVSQPGPRPVEVALLASVFIVSACGLVYELAAGALASYLLGDSVLQFSTVIGTYLFAMGVGSWLSRYFERQLPAHFLRIEVPPDPSFSEKTLINIELIPRDTISFVCKLTNCSNASFS